ncbi:hypothetical protein FB451DRAFT_1558909 [Mycena latifolia]|nr:hypothetical protein FB451DRAFT_1558909 [Mycena latifolia]
MASTDSDDGPFTPEEELMVELIRDMRIPQAILFSDTAFNDPLRPQYCAKCLHGIWLLMFETDDDGALPAAFHFIVYGRTEAQMTSLIEYMSSCRCEDTPHDVIDTEFIRSFHENAEEIQAMAAGVVHLAAPPHFHSLMKILSIRILTTLRKTNPIKLAKNKGRQEWPTTLEDIIIPSVGPETTVKSLEQWIRRMSIEDPWPIELLSSIAYIARSLICPAMLHSPTLLPTIVRTALEICDDAASHLSPLNPVPKITEASDQLVWRLPFITGFFSNIFLRSGGSPGVLDNLPLEQKKTIMRMCAQAIDLVKSPLIVQHAPEEDRTTLIHDFTSTLTLVFDLDVPTDGIDPALIHHALTELNRTLNGPPLTIIRILLMAWKQSMRCYARSCPESLQTSHTFKRCSGCKVVSYCGPECQRRAWRDHKPLCRAIAKIIRDGGGDIESETFKQNCEAGKVDADEAQMVVGAFSAWRSTHGRVNV